MYFPSASEQTIILSTDTEITKEYYEMMKPNIDSSSFSKACSDIV